MRKRILASAALVAWTCWAASARAEEREVYRRAVPTEMETGVVQVGFNPGALVTLPRRCELGPLGCRQDVRVERAYRIDFLQETFRAGAERPSRDVDSRGQILLALRMEQRDAVAFDQELRSLLQGLPAEAFRYELAGLALPGRAFPDVASRSKDASLACAKAGERWRIVRFHREVERGPDGTETITGIGTETFGETPEVEELCRTFSEQAVGYPATEIRTPPSLRRVEETAVTVRTRLQLIPQAAPDELLALPRRTRYFARPKPDVERAGSSRVTGEGYLSTLTRNGIETTAFVTPADLPPDAPVVNAWISRWTVERRGRTFGPEPSEERLASESFVYVLLPTLPPRPISDQENEGNESVDEAESAPSRDDFPPEAVFAVSLDEATLVSAVARELDGREEVSVSVLEDILQAPPAGTGDAVGWVWVLCHADGSARWGLAPTAAQARLLNADLFCGAAEAQIP